MDTLPYDVLVVVVEKAALEQVSSAITVQSLRLVNRRFHAAVEQAAFALRPSSGLTAEQLRKVGSLFPGVRQLNLSGCGHLDPGSLLDLLREIGSPAFCPRTRETDVSGCSQLRLSPQALFGVQPNLTGLHTLASWLEGSAAAQLAQLFPQLRTLNLSECDEHLPVLPDVICTDLSLTSLTLGGCSRLAVLPQALTSLGGLRVIKLQNFIRHLHFNGFVDLEEIPEQLLILPLRQLELIGVRALYRLPEGISQLELLEKLKLVDCPYLERLSDGISGLSNLRILELGLTHLRRLPEGISGLASLRELTMHHCSNLGWPFYPPSPAYVPIPEGISSLVSLESLEIRDAWSLKVLPDSLSLLTTLTNLAITGCGSILVFLGRPEYLRASFAIPAPLPSQTKKEILQATNPAWLSLSYVLRCYRNPTRVEVLILSSDRNAKISHG